MSDKNTERLGHLYRLIHNGIDRYFTINKNEVADLKLTHSQCGVMWYLYDRRDQDVFQKDLESVFQISGATASNTLKGMEKQKVIERVPMADDARKKKISLTERGIRIHESAVANMDRLESILATGMTDEEKSVLRGLLRKTIQNLDIVSADVSDHK